MITVPSCAMRPRQRPGTLGPVADICFADGRARWIPFLEDRTHCLETPLTERCAGARLARLARRSADPWPLTGARRFHAMRYVFADCVLDTQRCVLTRDGRVVALRPKVFRVLWYLLTQP